MSRYGTLLGVYPGPVITKTEQDDNARTGATAMVEVKGTLSELQQLEQQWLSLGPSDINISSTGTGNFQLRATFPFAFDGLVTDLGIVPSIHELDVREVQDSYANNPILRNTLSDSDIQIVAFIVRDFQAGKYADTAGRQSTTAAEADVTSATSDAADSIKLFRLLAYRGEEYYVRYDYVYRRTLTCATAAQVTLSHTGVSQIWTTNEVSNFEGIPPDGIFQLPVNAPWIATPTPMVWLKSAPQVVAATGQKTQLVYSYTGAVAASSLMYAPYGAAVLF